MTAESRRNRILEQVVDSRSMNVAELAAEFGVSEMTVRRDIRRLEEEGFVRRTYGGAIATGSRPMELAVNSRTLQRAREKRIIGMTMARLLDTTTQSVFVGMGTTTEQFARYVVPRDDLVISTPSITIAALLAARRVKVTALGGQVRREEMSMVGPLALQSVDRYRFEVAILGAAALNVEEGIFDLNDEEAEVHRLAARRSARTVVLIDSSKIGGVGWTHVAPLAEIDQVVTDEGLSKADEQALVKAGVDVYVATPTTAVAGTSSD